MEYTIETFTGSRRGAGSDGHIGISLFGARASVTDHALSHECRTNFREGSRDTFTVSADDLGEIRYIELYVEGKPWFLDKVVVTTQSGAATTFPAYAWVTRERLVVFEGHASLPSSDVPEIAAARALELERRRGVYEWAIPENGLPPHLQEQNLELLPLDEEYTEDRDEEFDDAKKHAEWNLKVAAVRLVFDPWDSPVDERHLYPILTKPELAERAADPKFDDDAELAWQTVAGVAPNHVRRAAQIDQLPKIWSDALAKLDLLAGKPLAELASQGALYFIDDSTLEDIPMYDDGTTRRYAPAGSCLFRREGSHLVPFAIRLASGGRITTRKDGDAWKIAKTYLRAAEANVHQVVTHAVRTHLALEPYILATMRQLSSRHPLFKLLRRHFRGTIRINAEARQLLLAAGGVFDEFIACGGPKHGQLVLGKKAWAAWSLADNQPDVDLERRGFTKESDLDYPFAAASGALYESIATYVRSTLALYYGNGELTGDAELAAWLEELRIYAHVGGLAGPTGTLPTFDSLVTIVATVIYTASVLHAAVNFQQYEHFGFVPNAPAAVRTPPSDDAPTSISAAEWMGAYPDFKQTARQIAVSYSLSRKLPDDEFLLPKSGAWREAYFVELQAVGLIAGFHESLRGIKHRIESEGRQRGRTYACLLPDEVPTSTTI